MLLPPQIIHYGRRQRRLNNPSSLPHPYANRMEVESKLTQKKLGYSLTILVKIFTPNIGENAQVMLEDNVIPNTLNQSEMLTKEFTIKKVQGVIQKNRSKKAPSNDLITGRLLKKLPEIGVKFLTFYNAILRNSYVPSQWKVAEIILILKPGKFAEDAKSYRPISLLLISSKVMEILFIKRLKPIIEDNNLIPKHQFGFRSNHSIIEQVHRIVDKINNSFLSKKYCSAVFLDVSQAFDKVWHDGLLCKITQILPSKYYKFLRSYLKGT